MADTKVIMPQMGESVFEGTITRWLKKPGDKVARDDLGIVDRLPSRRIRGRRLRLQRRHVRLDHRVRPGSGGTCPKAQNPLDECRRLADPYPRPSRTGSWRGRGNPEAIVMKRCFVVKQGRTDYNA